jgi:hypothetical protein
MNKLLIALTAGALALGSVAATAQEKTPAQPVDQAKLKAEAAAAKAEKAKMTPAQKKAKRAKKQKEVSAVSKEGETRNKMEQQQEEKAAAAASKGQPKALPDKAAKQKALKEQEKKAGQ